MIKISATGVPTATTNAVTYEIMEELARRYCTGGVAPVVSVNWSVAEQSVVNGALYAKIQAVVGVTYRPKGGSRMVSEYFVEEFYESWPGASAGAGVEITTATGPQSAVNDGGCCCTARGVRATGVINFTYSAS